MDKDLIRKRCLSDNVRFADLLNGLLFGGSQRVKPEELQTLDSQYNVKGAKKRYRDLVKKAAFDVNFVVFGIENQEEVHYLMPLRNMLYDAMEYERQAAMHKATQNKNSGSSSAEFLSGFTREDRLKPCITLVLYYGEDWNGSRDLHGILDFSNIPEELQPYINNYYIHVFEVAKLEDTRVFQTDLRQIFEFIKYAKDKRKLRELVQGDAAYCHMAEEAFDMIVASTGAKELTKLYNTQNVKDNDVNNSNNADNAKGGVNMCQALTEMLQDERNEGREVGREEGMLLTARIFKAVRQGNTNEQVAKLCECTLEEVVNVRKAFEI